MAPGKYLILGAALLASALADPISFSEWPTSLTAGQSVTLKWVGGSDAPATITLRKGASTDLHDVQVLTNDATNGEFSWTPPADLQNSNDYAFQINQGDEVNYTGLLPLSGGSDAPKPDDKTQKDAVNQDSTAAAAAAAAATTTTSSDPSSGSVNTEPPAATIASDAGATSGITTSSSEGSSTTTSTQTASPSKMNTPFVGSKRPSSTATALTSVQTGSASRAVTVPLAVIGGSIAFLLLVQ
ncbi:hypothetical protein UA08_06101 [Talaromyces atroroseus]|uniref:Yeast cell wall synthesis Kre9/Knh1-like N-terminal domain-containing protein n=1 Tax=Talaromyces atroroseus TaxID=1441469 RepID=A0A225AH97_TALAT|nr:hypothetical protein UA08_06101 [Talaromyces atroroseus]OKL58603.1 hypothetical protein UA08_06101 [Talaromyces atroroseus]